MNKKLASTARDLETLQNKKDADYESLHVSGDSELEGDINAGSNLNVAGSGNFDGDLTVGGELQVTGKAALQTALAVKGDTTFNDSASVLGVTSLGGSLDVAGAIILQSGLEVTGDTSFGSTLTVTGSTSVAGSLDVADSGTLRGILSVGEDVSFGGGITLAGAANFGGSLDIIGVAQLQSTLTVGGDVSVDASVAGASVGFSVQGASIFGGDVSVTGVAQFNSTFLAGTTDNSATFDGTVTNNGITSLLTAGATFTVQGTTGLGGDLNVDGVALLNGAFSAGNGESTATFDGTANTTTVGADGVVTTSTALLSGNAPSFTVQGATTLGGELGVTGVASLGAGLTVSGAISTTTTVLSDGTATTTTGASDVTATFDGTATNSTTTVNGTTTTTMNVTSLLSTNNLPTFAVQGGTTLGGDLSVVGITQLDGGLNVQSSESTAKFDGTALDGANNTFSLSGTSSSFFVNGGTTLGGDLDVTGISYFNSTLSVVGDTTINGLQGGATDFYVAGPVSIIGDLTSNGNTFYNDALSVTGAATIDGDIRVKSANVNGSLIGGNIYAETIRGADRITSPKFGFAVSDTDYVAGYTNSGNSTGCDSGYHYEIRDVRGGLVIGASGGSCVQNQSENNETITGCSSGEHIHISKIQNGAVTGAACKSDSAGYDLAENYESTQQLAAGDVVAIDITNSEYIVKASGPHDDHAIGVVSTQPGLTLGASGAGYPVALSGRVPVKVTNEGGSIAPGDYLTSASMPGYAKKAAPGEKTIGQALESFNGTTGTVKMFVNVSPSQTQMQAIVQGAGGITQGGSATLSSLNVSGLSTLTDLQVVGTATISTLVVTGQTTVARLIVTGHLVGNDDTRGTVTIPKDTKTIHRDFKTPYDNVPTVVASPTNEAVLYTVKPTKTGFDITIPSNATNDTSFSFLVQE